MPAEDVLRELTRNFIRSVDEADVAWFDANLSDDFRNTNPDGTFIDRPAFLAQIGRGSPVTGLYEDHVTVRLFGDFAIVHGRTNCVKADDTRGHGRSRMTGCFTTDAGCASLRT